MRAHEILQEGNDYTNKVESALADLLATLKANGISEIDTSKLCQQLNQMGFNADAESLIPVLQSSPFVSDANEKSVTLGAKEDSSMGGDNGGDGQSSSDMVSDLAQKAVN
jgi:hypothetical protein